MATTRTIGTKFVPVTTDTTTFYVAGDDLQMQKIVPESLNALSIAIFGSTDAKVIDSCVTTLQPKHRPVGQRGNNKPTAVTTMRFLNTDTGKFSTLSVKTEISVDNNIVLTNAAGTATRSDTKDIANLVIAALSINTQSLLNPGNVTTATDTDVRANVIRLLNGIILVSA